jgi:hypothetical protein
MTKKSTKAGRGIEVSLPALQLNDTVSWEYRITSEGFETRISVKLPGRTISMCNTLPWDAFIHGLAQGWQKYHQENPEFTHLLNDFIKEQIEAGNYTARSQEEGE